MALALAQYEDLFQLVSGYLYWPKNDLLNRVQCGLYPLVYRLCVIMPSGRGALHLFANQNPSGPNPLDEPLKDFIVTPVCSPWKCFGSCKLGHMGIMTHSESVQPLQSVKLVYQLCSWSRAALDHMEQMITKNYWFMLFIIHVYIDHVFYFRIETTCCYSYAKIVTTKS